MLDAIVKRTSVKYLTRDGREFANSTEALKHVARRRLMHVELNPNDGDTDRRNAEIQRILADFDAAIAANNADQY